MHSTSTATVDDVSDAEHKAGTRHILSFVYFTFVCYLSIGLPLAVLPPYVHLRMGYSAVLAGLVISTQYIATLASRPWAGRISDRAGAKVSVLWGMARARRAARCWWSQRPCTWFPGSVFLH